MSVELVVISGKGGTGKTSVTAGLAALQDSVVLADCDVDGSDLPLLMASREVSSEPFVGGHKAAIDAERCRGCGWCVQACRFQAIHQVNGDNFSVTFEVDSSACEGCGACRLVCDENAIRFEPAVNGSWMISDTAFGPMVHACLKPGEDNSGKLVSLVRAEARKLAVAASTELILSDGSPGIGCPVIASLTDSTAALTVAEPSPSGHHDAMRVIEVARQLRVPVMICVNRWDWNPELAETIEAEAAARGATIVRRLHDDELFVRAQLEGKAVTQYAGSRAAQEMESLWEDCWRVIEPLGRANATAS